MRKWLLVLFLFFALPFNSAEEKCFPEQMNFEADILTYSAKDYCDEMYYLRRFIFH